MSRNSFMPALNVEATIWALAITLEVSHGYTLTSDDRLSLAHLISNNPDCTARRLFRAISLLTPGNPLSEDISSAILKVTFIFDRQLFHSGSWWQNIEALKAYDELSTSREVIQ